MKEMKIILALLLTFALAGTAFGACAVGVPGASATLTGAAYTVNITGLAFADPINCSVTASSTLTSDSLAASTAYNTSDTTTVFNVTIDSTAFEDATDWAFAATCQNTTGDTETCTGRSSVTVDNTNPTAPTFAYQDGNEWNANDIVSYAVTGAQTTACTLYIGTSTFTMTHAGSTCKYTLTDDMVENDVYEVYVEASDGTDTTDSAKVDLTVETSGKGDGSVSGTPTSSKAKTNPLWIVGLVIVIVLAIANDNKKGKKK